MLNGVPPSGVGGLITGGSTGDSKVSFNTSVGEPPTGVMLILTLSISCTAFRPPVRPPNAARPSYGVSPATKKLSNGVIVLMPSVTLTVTFDPPAPGITEMFAV
jgi:hypothetical protein